MDKKPYIVVIRNNEIETITPVSDDNCGTEFLSRVQANMNPSDWLNMSEDEFDRISTKGVYKFEGGSVSLTWVRE